MNVSANFHTARGVSVRRVCINGQWQLNIVVELEDDGRVDLTIFADTREALEFAAPNDQYCRITGGDANVEYSDKPFDMLGALKDRMSSADRSE